MHPGPDGFEALAFHRGTPLVVKPSKLLRSIFIRVVEQFLQCGLRNHALGELGELHDPWMIRWAWRW